MELDFHTKGKTAIRMPTLNFMDTRSMQTWLETRKLVRDIGERFQIRIQLYTSFFMLICAILLIFIFAVLSNIVHSDVLTPEQWVNFAAYSTVLFLGTFFTMMPSAYLNAEMRT